MDIDIPGFGMLHLKYLVADFTGTLACNGKLIPGVFDLLEQLAGFLEVHVLTGDTYGVAKAELAGVNCTLMVMDGSDITEQKKCHIDSLGADAVVAIGNGSNDHLMLKAARLGIAVIEGEGCAVSALLNADVAVKSIHEAFGLLLSRKACIATLRT